MHSNREVPGRFEVITSARDSMRDHPMKWTAIAAAGGIGVGLAGRYAQWRVRTRISPELVVIEKHRGR